ncbi:TPMT family class I SAM-dependent methyltransferase [Flavobacterium sp. 7A]|uniref:TPMT family class I SAM-dependent methyltransferase n=1 Tax=Flavobacterium sp. 7A TaxID=2940571 RepID=UPI0022263017|nr:TPMT family class I SAM-dependent methyltransferase [Flavobacterium sp. 7A]MCW2118558.1 SAM-dependent methyltransferase [Flavobacterium sp. 7A]
MSKTLDQKYWDTQYKTNCTGWDLGCISPPIKTIIDKLEDKNIAVLIPGCGNTYEAEYLLQQGFTNITVIDIAPTLVSMLQLKFANNDNITIVLGDFYSHQGQYDLILEQTFFCALAPHLRQHYVFIMHQLLIPNGTLSGLLFNKTFESGPPFGGNKKEYELLFKNAFNITSLEISCNSVLPRSESELAFTFVKDNTVTVKLYELENTTGTEEIKSIKENISQINTVLNVSISTNGTTILLVTEKEIPLLDLQFALPNHVKLKIATYEKCTLY